MALSQKMKLKIRKLRAEDYTYAEIQKEVRKRIPKSSLSYICKDVKQSRAYQQRIRLLNKENLNRARKVAICVNRKKREKHLQEIDKRARKVVGGLRGLNAKKVALAMLHIGEGAKWKSHSGLMLGGTDSDIIRLYIALLDECYGISISQFRCRIGHRADQDVSALQRYWSKVTGIPMKHFYQTRPDPRTIGKPTRKKNYKGVCVVSCAGAEIQLELESIAKFLAQELGH